MTTIPDDLGPMTAEERATFVDSSIPPRGDDHAALCVGEQVTVCCGAFVTFHDAELCCKVCWRLVGLG